MLLKYEGEHTVSPVVMVSLKAVGNQYDSTPVATFPLIHAFSLT